MTFEERCYYTKFIKFLKDNDCFDKFKENWYNLLRFYPLKINGKYEDEIIDFKFYFFKRRGTPYCYSQIINDSFDWSKTPERDDYWSDIHKKWKKECETLIGELYEFETIRLL